MDNTYHHTPADSQQAPVYNGGYLETPFTVTRPPPPSAVREPTQPDPTATRWTASQGNDSHPYGFRSNFPPPSPGGGGFEGPRFVHPYAFDPSVPPPPFGCPPPGHFLNTVPTASVNTYSSGGAFQTFTQQFRSGYQTTPYDPTSSQKRPQHEYADFSESGAPFGCRLFPPRGQDHDRSPGMTTRAEEETALQSKQDQQWLRRFLQSRDNTSKTPQTQQQQQQQQHSCIPDLRQALYSAAQLVSQLEESCETLRNNVENACVWTDSHLMALNVKRELQDKLSVLSHSLDCWKTKVSRVAKRRTRRLRARKLQQVEEKQREDHISEKEAAIDQWRMQQIRQVEEKKKEQELKLAADAVLCEVRKKQADVKRMQDVLRSLEKLRRLRKEAALRKGIVTDRECEEAFNSQLDQLRCVLKKRTAVYSAEEKALMVMLEGEQEEERRREWEKRVKKKRERQLQRKHRVDAMLFGDEPPADSVLQPFTEFYTQAESSLHALLQIRREWDVFVVAADHPDGSPVPQSWILPDAPSDQAWASALHTADTEL